MLELLQAGIVEELNQVPPCPPTDFLWKGRQQEGLDGLDRCPGSFFLWNRRPRNRSFQPAHPFSPLRQLEPMALPVQKFQYAGFGTR
jgi:hypothetical protein